jgi:uncharacterized membrane protein
MSFKAWLLAHRNSEQKHIAAQIAQFVLKLYVLYIYLYILMFICTNMYYSLYTTEGLGAGEGVPVCMSIHMSANIVLSLYAYVRSRGGTHSQLVHDSPFD